MKFEEPILNWKTDFVPKPSFFAVPEGYSEPNQTSKMECFAKI